MMQQPYTITPDMHEMVGTASSTNCLLRLGVQSDEVEQSADQLRRRMLYRSIVDSLVTCDAVVAFAH